jgi:sporulation protein YabP
MDKNAAGGGGSLIIERRERIHASGVLSVTGFDDTQIEADTRDGLLLIRGSGLKIESFDVELGELELSGKLDGLVYTQRKQRRGLMERLLK